MGWSRLLANWIGDGCCAGGGLPCTLMNHPVLSHGGMQHWSAMCGSHGSLSTNNIHQASSLSSANFSRATDCAIHTWTPSNVECDSISRLTHDCHTWLTNAAYHHETAQDDL